MQSWVIFSAQHKAVICFLLFLGVMSPELHTSPSSPQVSVCQFKPPAEKFQVNETTLVKHCQFCRAFGGQESAETGGRAEADFYQLLFSHGSYVTKNHESPLSYQNYCYYVWKSELL